MKQMKIGISDQMEQIIKKITARKQYKSKSSCVNALLLSHPEVAQEMESVLQGFKNTESETMSQDEGIFPSSEDIEDEKTAKYFPQPIFGKDAIEIQDRAKILGITPTEYLVNCHRNIRPVIIDLYKNDASDLGAGFEELKKTIFAQSHAVISILKNAQGQIGASDLNLIENYQEEILKSLENIKDLIKRDMEETASFSRRTIQKIRKILRQDGGEFFIS